MYCINCGVKLGETEKSCPLCRTPVILPEGTTLTGKPLYPQGSCNVEEKREKAYPVMMSVVAVMAIIVVLLCDLADGGIRWCGYPIGALLVGYVLLVLPAWFQRPNPVIFTPCFFGAAALYLLYIDLSVGSGWFLPFAFPVTGGLGLIVTTLVTLLRYVHGGKLFVVGGSLMGLGAFMLLVEFLLGLTFEELSFVGWSLYPLAALMLLGGFLIFLGICRPARESMKRKFFY